MSIQSSLAKIDQSRLRTWSPRTLRTKLGMTEAQATAAGIAPSQGKTAHPVQKRADSVIAKAKEYGLKPMELDAYDVLVRAIKDTGYLPTRLLLCQAAGTASNGSTQQANRIYERLEAAGLIRRREIAEGITEVYVVETGQAAVAMPRGRRDRRAA